jgi:DNA-binding transcriptional MerR regulator
MKNKNEDSMLISEFGKKLGITPRAVRLYEQMGLVGPPQRSDLGIRHYCEADFKRFKFVLELKEIGISLEEMKKLADIPRLIDTGSEKSTPLLSELLETLEMHLKNIKQKIASLKSLQGDVEKFKNNVLVNCSGRYGSDSGLNISRK